MDKNQENKKVKKKVAEKKLERKFSWAAKGD